MPEPQASESPAAWSRIARRIRVPLGFVFAAFYLWRAKPTWTSLAIGAAIALLGIFVRAVASGHVEKNRELTMTGPYAYVRNPLYLGSIIIAHRICPGRARHVGLRSRSFCFSLRFTCRSSARRKHSCEANFRSMTTTRAACPACFPTRCCCVKSRTGSRASYTSDIASTMPCWALRPCWRRWSLRSSGFPG